MWSKKHFWLPHGRRETLIHPKGRCGGGCVGSLGIRWRCTADARHDVARSSASCRTSNSMIRRRPGNANPLEAAALSEQASVVREVLLDLPDEYALLLSAKYFDDISVEQLAADTRSSEVAVRSKLARARQAFRGVFERRVRTSQASSLTE